jgi:3-oxoacyl-[acyl-carrier-protein] synthase II
MNQERRVVVTGVGPIASTDGFHIDNFNIRREALEDIRSWKKGKADRDLDYLLAAVRLAIVDSKIEYDTEDNNIGLFLTVEHPGFETFCEELVQETASYSTLKSHKEEQSQAGLYEHVFERFSQRGYDLQSFMYLYLIAKAYDIHGYSLFTNNACASGLYALESAVRQIRYGGSNIAILAAGDHAGTKFKHLWFKKLGLYAEDGKMKPFSIKADGMILGEGASAVVLEEFNHAVQRNAHIYAEYLGGGFSLEGWKVALPRIGSTSYQKSIRSALKISGLEPKDIDLVNPHGVALKGTDAYEAKAITDIFGFHAEKPFITALKPYVGHNLGGSSIVESIMLLLAMNENVIPPTLNCNEIEPKYNMELVNELTPSSLNTVVKLSCGFAGYNAAVIFSKVK